jgi:hypothetical protein
MGGTLGSNLGLPNTDTTGIINALQAGNISFNALLTLFKSGITVNTAVPTYTVAGLPATAPLGVLAFATNGRANASQGAGAGTGCLIVGSGTAWNAVWSGVTVTS